MQSNLIQRELHITVLSAGQSDGNSAIITKNGENLIPENTLGGHHVCVFEDSTYKFIFTNDLMFNKVDKS